MNWLKQQAANIAGTQEPIYGPSAIRPVGKHPGEPAYTELTRDDLKWVGLDSTSVETQCFYLFAKSGHLAMTQVIYSNVAGLRTTCQFNTKIFYPNQEKPNLWSSDPLSGHKFSKDHTAFLASGCSVELNEAGDAYHIKSSTNKQSIVDLEVKRTAPGFQAGKTGHSYYGTDAKKPWGSMRHAFWPRCASSGTIMTKDGPITFDGGQALFVHALQGMKPHHAAAKWNFLDFQSPSFSAVMMEFTTPASYGTTLVNVGAIVKDGTLLYAGTDNSVKHTAIEQATADDWPAPSAVEFKWSGTTPDGKPITAELGGSFGKRLDRVDVMAEVPGFIKSFVGHAVGIKPYIYQYSPQQRLKLKVVVDGEEQGEEGDIFSEATFISA